MRLLIPTLALATISGVLANCAKKQLIIDTDFYNLVWKPHLPLFLVVQFAFLVKIANGNFLVQPDDSNALAITNIFETWGEVNLLGVISGENLRP